MPNVIADITMSLDGFVTGEGADEQHGLGDAPELHTWVMKQEAVDTEILEQATAESGAVVMGRRLFDIVNGPDGWNKDMGYGADQVGTPPFFVVTHSPPHDVRLERELGMRLTFVSDLVTAIERARSAATHGDVVIMGGGDVIGQALEQGLVDELRLHLAPMVLGGGTPLFKKRTRQMFRQRDVRPSQNAVHLTYERLQIETSGRHDALQEAREGKPTYFRETATLDGLSRGRLTLGVGIGSDRLGGEFSKTGEQLDDRVRGEMLDEALHILTAAWSGEPVHHRSHHYRIDGIRFLPRPVQRPGVLRAGATWLDARPPRNRKAVSAGGSVGNFRGYAQSRLGLRHVPSEGLHGGPLGV